MKRKSLSFCLFVLFLGVINTFCIWAIHTETYKNLNASTATAYFNLETNTASASDKAWNLSFNRTSIEIAAGTGIQVLDKAFDEVTEAPKAGYLTVLEKGSGNSWYEYDMLSHAITPLPQKTLIVKLASGKYAKIEIESYYKDGKGDSGYYTFRYAFIN